MQILSTFVLVLATLFLPLAGHAHEPQPAAASTTPVLTPIRTRAELLHYLKVTPASESPLSSLPPGARRRFLGTLVWGRKGIGGFSSADLEQYLTNSQIRAVLSLFNLQGYASGIHGRMTPLAAAQRNAPETSIEHGFDQLYFADQDDAHGIKHHVSVSSLYDRLLHGYQNRSSLAKLDDSDVGLLFRAAGLAAYKTHDPRYLHDLGIDLTELHNRGLATPRQIAEVHDALVAARRFKDANALASAYPAADIKPLPPLKQAPDVHDGYPTVLVMEAKGNSMLHKAVDMHESLRLVVVAGCHFSEDAVRAIRADPKLDKLFRDHAIWLANENEPPLAVLQWNREFPHQPMYIAWRNSEWPMLDSWAIPTFYVFRDGNLVDQWSGWQADTGLQSLRTHLEIAGLLH